MANMVYANPFGSMVEGAHAGLQDTLAAAAAARNLRSKDNAYDFLKWYVQPAQKEQLNTETGMEKLKALAALSHYTGNYDLANNAINQYFGINPNTLPNYAPGQQQRGIDLASGLLNPALAYSDVQAAGGIQRFSPGRATAVNQPLSPQDAALYNLVHSKIMEGLQNPAQPAAAARNPYQIPSIEEGFPQKPAAPASEVPTSAPATAAPTSMADTVTRALMGIANPAAAGGVPAAIPTAALKPPAATVTPKAAPIFTTPGMDNETSGENESGEPVDDESQSSAHGYKPRPPKDIFGQQTGQTTPTQVMA